MDRVRRREGGTNFYFKIMCLEFRFSDSRAHGSGSAFGVLV